MKTFLSNDMKIVKELISVPSLYGYRDQAQSHLSYQLNMSLLQQDIAKEDLNQEEPDKLH